MAVPVMVRFDDDVANMLRERAHLERRSLNRVVNDVMRHYLETKGGTPDEQAQVERAAITASVNQHVEYLLKQLKALNRQESDHDVLQKVVDLIPTIVDSIQALRFAVSPEDIPTVRERQHEKVRT